MNLLFAIFFGAGVAGWAYATMGRRAGYGNTGNVAIICGVVFVIATIVFYTAFTTFLTK
jgi:hypothetical protein